MSELTQEQVEMIQRRIDDHDWDISQQNDVYELLPLFLEMKEEFDDAHAERVKVLNEQCAPDELHCVCVPTLRAEITRLRADLAAAVEALKGARPLVEAMVGIGSSARFVLPEIDALLSRIEGGEKEVKE